MKQVALIVILTILTIFVTIQSYKLLPLLINDKFRGSFMLTLDESKTQSNLYPPKNLEVKKVTDTSVEISWDFDKKELTLDPGEAPEYAIMSGYRIYKDGYWHTDVSSSQRKFIDEDLLPNETYKYEISALTFDNKIEGLKSDILIYKTGNFAMNPIDFQVTPIKTYLAEGDSITKAEGIPNRLGWAERVADNYGLELFNKAVSGSTSLTVNDRIENEIKEIDPDLVTIAVGVNDIFNLNKEPGHFSMSTYRDNLKNIVKKAKNGRNRNIVLLNIFYINCCEEKHIAWDKEVKGVANSLGVMYIDVSSPMIKNGGKALLEGDLHPNSEGHRIISEAVIGELSKFVK